MLADIDYIESKIDWEGWPEAIEWLADKDFGDQYLNDTIAEAVAAYEQLNRLRSQLTDRVHELVNIDE